MPQHVNTVSTMKSHCYYSFFCTSILSSIFFCATLASADDAKVNFSRDVRPLLAKACFACHGNDEESREAELRLDLREAATAKRDRSQAIVPGDSKASELIRRITSEDPDVQMPPVESGERLTAKQVSLLKRWIDQGANYDAHWAFVPPKQPALPKVKQKNWPRGAIDTFVLAELQRRQLQPSAPADKTTLIRRVYLDLIGLPPSPQQVDAFLNDQSDDAYEKVVDRLLASPRFGERWAQMWLDLARYADSMGYEKDLPRTIWRYRDWVIDAFNTDMPFDQFTIEQLAGDMLPDATLSQKIATAMHRNTLTNQEGGTDDEEFRVAAVKDRVDTTMQVWMGLTMGCAKCHSHKYDPITHDDYYRFYAIFNQTADADRGNDFPVLATPTTAEQENIAKLDRQLAELKKKLSLYLPGMNEAYARWHNSLANDAKRRKEAKLPPAIAKALQTEPGKRTIEQNSALENYYAAAVAPENETLRKQEAVVAKQRAAIRPTTTPIMQELAESRRRKTHIHVRGNFLDHGEAVEPAVPKSFGSLAGEKSPDRLAVARWLVDPENPLTARVQVNRFWARLFGRGIVFTEEDFGTQGMSPSHPELHDWLAVEFVNQGWSVKKLLRMMVTSATYRQSSRVTEELLKADPENTWLARGPRFRLEAETIRDQALAAAGLLSDKTHGPSVMPPQPAGLWKVTYSTLKWKTSESDDRHRRALYTYWRRTSPYPSMLTFDAGTRETCVLRRVRTNTPLQALVTLNDPVYVEAAGALAGRILSGSKSSLSERLEFGFRLVLVRKPDESERKRLEKFYGQALSHFQKDSDAAAKLIEATRVKSPSGVSAAEFAAWIVLGNALLNLDETMMKP